jgi:hypothetical protein
MSEVDPDSYVAAVRWARNRTLWELGGFGKCWVCGGRTTNRIEGPTGRGRHRCPGCVGEGYVTYPDGTPFRAPDPDTGPRIEVSLRKTPAPGTLPDWWARMPACKTERAVQTVTVADGRRPEIDPLLLGPPDKVRAATQRARAAGWEVWSAYVEHGGVADRGRILMVAYRGAEMVVLPWNQEVDLTWKAGKGSRWFGRVPDGAGQVSMTALMKIVTEVQGG